ncbi:MAG: phage major tail tube protein [Desulfovibrionaceae bacterium]
MAIPKVLKNFTVFVDGVGYAGKVAECEPPKLKVKREDFNAGGMAGPRKMDMGLEAMEATMTFEEYSPELFKQFGLVPGGEVGVTMRGAMQANTPDAQAIIAVLRGKFHEDDLGTWKPGDKSQFKLTMDVHYYKLTINGEDLREIDMDNGVRIINGTDQMASVREALGL